MEVVRTADPTKDAGEALTGALRRYADKPILLMVSGGSAFQLLDFVEQEVLRPHVTLTVLDERFSIDPMVNNFAQLEQTSFYQRCVGGGVNTIRTNVLEGENLHDLSSRFEAALFVWKKEHPGGIIITTMGIGSDGHTAGIFPSEYNVDFNSTSWVVGYQVSKDVNEHLERVTVTRTFLQNEVGEAIVYAADPRKREVVEKVEAGDCDSLMTPACVLRRMKHATLFTDIEDEASV